MPGIRPGNQTAEYIDSVMTKLTVWGSGYLILVCLMPQFLIVSANVPFYLGGTSLLIAVVVVMDFMAQVQSHLMSQQYESLLKKANINFFIFDIKIDLFILPSSELGNSISTDFKFFFICSKFIKQ